MLHQEEKDQWEKSSPSLIKDLPKGLAFTGTFAVILGLAIYGIVRLAFG